MSIAVMVMSGCDTLAAHREFNHAETLWRQAQYRAAAERYEHVAAAYPSSSVAAEALYMAATTLHLSLNDPDEAAPLYERLAVLHPTSPFTARAHIALGDIAQTVDGNLATAVKEYRKALTLAPTADDAPELAYRIALAEVRLRRYADARKDFALLLQRYPQSPLVDDAAYGAATSYLNEGLPAAARTALDAFIARYPNSDYIPLATIDRANTFVEQGRLADALAAYEQLRPKTTRPHVVQEMIASLRERLRDETTNTP